MSDFSNVEPQSAPSVRDRGGARADRHVWNSRSASTLTSWVLPTPVRPRTGTSPADGSARPGPGLATSQRAEYLRDRA